MPSGPSNIQEYILNVRLTSSQLEGDAEQIGRRIKASFDRGMGAAKGARVPAGATLNVADDIEDGGLTTVRRNPNYAQQVQGVLDARNRSMARFRKKQADDAASTATREAGAAEKEEREISKINLRVSRKRFAEEEAGQAKLDSRNRSLVKYRGKKAAEEEQRSGNMEARQAEYVDAMAYNRAQARTAGFEEQIGLATTASRRRRITSGALGSRSVNLQNPDDVQALLARHHNMLLAKTPQHAAATQAVRDAFGHLATNDPDRILRAQLALLDRQEDLAAVQKQVSDQDAETAKKKGGGMGQFSSRLAIVMGTQQAIQLMGAGITQSLSQDALQSGEGGQAVMGALTGGARFAQAAGAGMYMAGKAGGLPLMIGGAVIGAISEGIRSLASQGAGIIGEVRERQQGYAAGMARMTMQGPSADDTADGARLQAARDAARQSRIRTRNVRPFERGPNGEMLTEQTTRPDTFNDLGNKLTDSWSMAGQLQRMGLQAQQIETDSRLARLGTDANTQLSGMAAGGGGMVFDYDRDIHANMMLSARGGMSGKGVGALMGARARGAGGAMGAGAAELGIRAFQGMGFGPDAYDALLSKAGGMASAAAAGGMSGNVDQLMALLAAQSGAGVAGERAFNVPQGYANARTGARKALTGGFGNIGKDALLAKALGEGRSYEEAIDFVENSSPEDMLGAVKGLGSDFITKNYLRDLGITGKEAQNYMDGKTSGLPGEMKGVPEVGLMGLHAQLQRRTEQLKAGKTVGEIEHLEKLNIALDGIKTSLSDFVTSLGVLSVIMGGQ